MPKGYRWKDWILVDFPMNRVTGIVQPPQPGMAPRAIKIPSITWWKQLLQRSQSARYYSPRTMMAGMTWR